MFFEERVAELMRKMLRKKLYVLISKPVVPPEKLKPFLLAHLEYMIGMSNAASSSPPVRWPTARGRRADMA